MAKFLADVDPIELAQAQVEKTRALALLLIQEYGTGAQLETLTDQDRTLIEVNLVTLYDLILSVKEGLDKAIDEAYKAQKQPA